MICSAESVKRAETLIYAATSPYIPPMNRNLRLLALCQGLLLNNNVEFIAINGLVGLRLAPVGWMATLPVMGYVVGAALSTPLVAYSRGRWRASLPLRA